ncbi:hypothetical protein AAY80_239 [Stenotrophomonas phage vB_SmaS-DLP_6]|nr:hypothetical protein AAY80_239 [Stenotrophomonas phage vB_SmaS-DLP_6]
MTKHIDPKKTYNDLMHRLRTKHGGKLPIATKFVDRKKKYSWDAGDVTITPPSKDDLKEAVEQLQELKKESPKKTATKPATGPVGSVWNRPEAGDKKDIETHVPSKESKSRIEKYHASLGDGSKRAIKDYKGNSYDGINKRLRRTKGAVSEKEDKESWSASDHHNTIHHLDKALNNSKTTEDHHVFRSFGGSLNVGELKKGALIHDHAYVSASHNHGVAHEFAGDRSTIHHKGEDGTSHFHHFVAKIHLPKGTKAHHLDNAEAKKSWDHPNSHEDEVLIHRGTTFKVTGHSVHSKAPTSWHDTWSGKDNKEQHHYHLVHMTVHKQEDHQHEVPKGMEE